MQPSSRQATASVAVLTLFATLATCWLALGAGPRPSAAVASPAQVAPRDLPTTGVLSGDTDGLTLRHATHSADFGPMGMRFTPAHGGPAWSWSLGAVSAAGGAPLAAVQAGAVEPRAEGDALVAYDRGGIVEQYLARAGDVEQRFVIPQPLELRGADLEIAGAVASEGLFEATASGWLWRDERGAVSLGDVYAFDATGREIPASMAVTADSTRIVVDGEALLLATYPVTVDPPIAPNDFRISDMGTNGVPSSFPAQPIPDLAYNPVSDQYLVVWSGRDGADGVDRIYGQLVNARTGADVGTNDFLIGENSGLANTHSRAPAVAYNTALNEFIVVWHGDETTVAGDANEIYAQRVSAAGSPIGGKLRVSSMGASDTSTSFDAFDPDVAYNPATGEYLVVWEGDDDTGGQAMNEVEIFAQRLAIGAGLVEVGADDVRISTMGGLGDPAYAADNAAVAYNSATNQYLVAWSGNGLSFNGESEIYGQLLNPDGTESGGDLRLDSPVGGDEAYDPALTYNPTDNEYLLLWQGEDGSGAFPLYARRLNAAAGVITSPPLRVTDNATAPTEDVFFPQVAYNPTLGEYLVVWHGEDASGFSLAPDEQEIFGRRYSRTLGTVEAPFVISDMGPTGNISYAVQTPAVAYSQASNNGYLVIWRGDDNTAPLVDEEFEIFGQFVAPAANLSVTKSASVPQAVLGQAVSFTITYGNLGPDPILGATLTDLLPAGLTSVSCSVGAFTGSAPVLRPATSCTYDIARLNSGQGGTITVAGMVDSTTTNGQVIANTASIGATTLYSDSNTANDSATASITVVDPVLDVTKTIATSTAGVDAGDTVRYQIRVAHRQAPDANYSRAAAYNVNLSDTLPSSLGDLTLVSAIVSDGATSTNVSGNFSLVGSVLQTTGAINLLLDTNNANDQVLTVTVQGRVTDSIASGATIDNSASATWRNSASVSRPSYTAGGVAPTITVPASFSVTKSVAAPGSNVPVGQVVTYRIDTSVIEGTTSSLQWVDTLPAGVSYVPGSAIISNANGMTISGFSASLAGQVLTLQASSVVNPGNVDNAAATDTDPFTIIYQATVNDVAGNVAGTVLTNDVDASAANVPSDTNNSASVTVVEPALSIDKTILTATTGVDAGDTLRYQIVVSPQAGSSANAFSVSISDDMPAALQGATIESATITDGATSTDVASSFAINGSGDLVTLTPPNLLLDTNGASDQALVIVIGGTVRDAIQPAGTIANAATVTWRNGAGVQRASYTATDLAPTITVPSVFSVAKSALTSNPAPGDSVTYQIATTVIEGTTNNLHFVDTLPAGLSYVPGSAAVSDANGMTIIGFSANLAGQVLTINMSSVVNPGNTDNASATDSDSFTISYQATVDAAVADGTVLTNDVDATANSVPSDSDNQATVTVDAPPTVVSITRVGASPTNASSVDFLVTFSESVSGVANADFALTTTGTIAGANVSAVSGAGTAHTVTVDTGTGDGTIRLDIPAAATVVDGAGKALSGLPFITGPSYSIDRTAPVEMLNQAAAQADPARTGPIVFTVIFSEPIVVASFTGADVSLSGTAGATTATVSEVAPNDGTTFEVAVSGMATDGTVTASIAAGVVSDPAGNTNFASISTDNTVMFDISGPTLTIDQGAAQIDPTGAGPIVFRVVFSEPIVAVSFTGADVSLGGTAGATTATVSEVAPNDGTTFDVAVSGMTGDGTVVASIAAGVVSDPAGNTNQPSTSTDNTVTYDTTAPNVTVNQAPAQADPAASGPIIFRVVFSEPIVATSFTGADVTLGGTAGATTAVVSEVAPNDGTTFEVVVSGMTGDGTVFANIAAGAVSDLGGTGNAPSSSTDNTVLYDATAPTVTIDQAPGQADPTNAGPVVFEVRFSEPVTGFDGTDVSLSGTAGAASAAVTGSGASYSVSVTGMASDGTVIAAIAAAAASDAAGNPSAASTSVDNSVTYDATAPTVTVEQAPAQADPSQTAPISFVAVFSEPVSGFSDADVTLGGTASPGSAAVSELAPNDGTTYAIAVGGMTSAGTVTAEIGAAVASDPAGNSNLASTSADNSVTFDPVAPLVTGIARADASPTNAASVSFLVTFSGAVTGVDQADFELTTTGTLSGASVTALSGSGATRTVTVSSGAGSGTLRLDLVDDDSIVDGLSVPLGGTGSSNGDFSGGQLYTIDRTAPLAGQLGVPAVAEGGADLTFTVVYSDDVAVSAASLGSDDILVSGPGGFAQAATLVGVSPAGDGTPLTATYRIAAPGGSWDAADNGSYSVAMATGRVFDTLGNSAAAAVLGDFSVSISRPVVYRVSLPMIFTGAKPLWDGGTFLRR